MNKLKCPKCGSENVIPIVYGLPIYKSIIRAEKGEIKLGGCCVSDYNFTRYCKDCEHKFLKRKWGFKAKRSVGQ